MDPRLLRYYNQELAHLREMGAEFAQVAGQAVAAQVRGGRADQQLHGEQAAGNQPFLGRLSQAKAHIHPVFHPVADAVVQLHIGLHLGVEAAVFIKDRPDDGLQHGAWPHDAQWPGDILARLPGALQGLLQALQRGLHRLQKALPLFGQRHAARGAVEQAHPQVLFQLGQRLAGGLRADLLDGRGLAQAAQLNGSDKGGDGAQLVEGHVDWDYSQPTVVNHSTHCCLVGCGCAA